MPTQPAQVAPPSGVVVPARQRPASRGQLAALLTDIDPLKLHVGCGDKYLPGFVNIDVAPDSKADLLLDVDEFHMFSDGRADVIALYHVFEHLHYDQARHALREWFRVLKPGGELILEMPNLDVCMREIGRHFDVENVDLALGGIYGYPPAISRDGLSQTHKWGWTPASLTAELEAAGYVDVAEQPIEQTWRVATAFNRDMQLRGHKPA